MEDKQKSVGKLSIVTEVGCFDNINIEDPTSKDIDKENEDMDALIEESIKLNEQNLTNL